MRILECRTASDIRAISEGLDSEQFDRDHADFHLVAIDDHEGPQGQCSLWWSETPALPSQRLGTIGHYKVQCDAAAEILLAAACNRLRLAGCTYAVGPMDGNSWRRYRFVSDPGTEPAFLLEPKNPPEWPRQFVAATFAPVAKYLSSINRDLSVRDSRCKKIGQRLRASDVVIRTLCRGEVESYLPRIYRVCCAAFTRNYLYTRLSEEDFLRQYSTLLGIIRPELFMVAEQHSETVGFLFAVPDLLRKNGGLPIDTFIIKTIAMLPRRELAGLGALMGDEIQQLGFQMGFRRCIHALMQTENMLVRNISTLYARPMRTYTLYAKDLRA